MAEEPVSAFSAYSTQKAKPKKSPKASTPFRGHHKILHKKSPKHIKNRKQNKTLKSPQEASVTVNGNKKSKKRKQSNEGADDPPTAKKEKKSMPSTSSLSPINPATIACQSTPMLGESKQKKDRFLTPKTRELPSTSSLSSDPPITDSIEQGKEVFKWLLTPVDFDKFFKTFWEKAPCLIQRNDSSYFAKLISCEAIDQMLLNNHVEFTKNIDVTSYENGVRETLNPEGRAMPPVIWGHYDGGCSIRLLNPQTFIQPIHVMNSMLQEFFQCMVGTNAYLTPPNSQGFAPHYDDIEAFVLQIEGQKRWKLYNPRTTEEQLPRFSSKNFSQEEIGEPILDQVLKPGDVLYFPRGTIHQACTQSGHHSLHITLSLYQKHSYADLFEILIPQMLSRAIQQEIELRHGLPLNIWQNFGALYTEEESRLQERNDIMEKCEKLMHKVFCHGDLDSAVDQMAKRFQHDALPPAITSAERLGTIFGAKTIISENGQVEYDYMITMDSNVRLLRANILRVVEEEDAIRIYYYVDNSKEYHEFEPNFLEIERESLPAVDQLIKSYPEYICTSELEVDGDEQKLSVVRGLWERGLLMVDERMDAALV